MNWGFERLAGSFEAELWLAVRYFLRGRYRSLGSSPQSHGSGAGVIRLDWPATFREFSA